MTTGQGKSNGKASDAQGINFLTLEIPMKHRVRIKTSLMVVTLAISVGGPLVLAADAPQEMAVRYILETAKAFRTVYSKTIVERADKVGVAPNENWMTEDHAIMLPAQFVKAAGTEIRSFELGLIGLTPIYQSNLPKTQAETDALKKMLENPDLKMVTFADGNQFKGLAADYAIVQACADCHNNHPKSPKKDFRRGDLMGAIVVRLNTK